MLLFKDIFIHCRSTYIVYNIFCTNCFLLIQRENGVISGWVSKELVKLHFFLDKRRGYKGKTIPDYIFFLVEAVGLKASLKTYNSYDIIMKYSSF